MAKSKLIIDEDKFLDYDPTPDDSDFLKFMNDRKAQMSNQRQKFENKWKRWANVYDGLMGQIDQADITGSIYNILVSGGTLATDEDTQPIYVRLVTAQVLLMLSEMSEKPPVVVLTALQKKDKAKAVIGEIIYKYVERQNEEGFKMIIRTLGSIIFGLQWTYDFYKCDKRKVKIPVNYDKKTKKYQYVELEKTDKEGVSWKDIPIEDVWADEGATNIAEAEDAFIRFKYSYNKFIAEFDKDSGFRNTEFVKPNRMIDVNADDVNCNFIYRNEEEDIVDVFLYYNQLKDVFAVVANGVLLTEIDRPNPFRHKIIPLSHMRHIPRSKPCLYWQGVPEIMDGLAKEYNILENLNIENLHNSIDQMTIWDDEALIDEEDYRNRPGGMAKVNLPPNKRISDVYAPLIKPPPPPQIAEEQSKLKGEVANITGIDNKLVSSIGEPKQTATETTAQIESLLKRVRLILKLSEPSLKRRAGMVLSNIQQFMTVPRVEQIVDEDKVIEYKEENRTIKLEGVEIKRISAEDRTKNAIEKKKLAGDTPGMTPEELEGDISTGDAYEVKEIDGYSFFEFKPEDITGKYDIEIQFEPSFALNKQMKINKFMQVVDFLLANPLTAPLLDPQVIADNAIELLEAPKGLIRTPANQVPEGEQPAPDGGLPPGGGQGAPPQATPAILPEQPVK